MAMEEEDMVSDAKAADAKSSRSETSVMSAAKTVKAVRDNMVEWSQQPGSQQAGEVISCLSCYQGEPADLLEDMRRVEIETAKWGYSVLQALLRPTEAPRRSIGGTLWSHEWHSRSSLSIVAPTPMRSLSMSVTNH